MKKEALNAYLLNNNLSQTGVYGYYEFNTGRKQFLYNNYYSGEQSPVLFSIVGFFIDEGGALYTNSDIGTIYSKSGEQKDLPFRVTVNGNGTITSAYIDAGNVGGNAGGNVLGNVGTGLYYETPTTFVASTNGEQAIIDPIMYANYESGTRYDLNPLVSFGSSTGVIRSALQTSLGSGHFSGRDCLRFSSGFKDTDWTIFIDYKTNKDFALGKSKVLLTSYDNWVTNKGFAVTIDDSFKLNFEYKTTSGEINNYPLSIDLQETNLISISKNSETNNFLFGKHNLTEEEHNFDSVQVVYSGNSHLYIGGIYNNSYANTGYTGFSGYINEILFLNQTCNSEQLTNLSNLFSVTGYEAAKSGKITGYYPIVTGVDTEALVTGSSGVVGYDLITGTFDGGTGYAPSGIVSGIVSTGIVVYYDPVNSGIFEDFITIPEQFFTDSTLKNKYAETVLSFEQPLISTDILEVYSFNSFDSTQPNNINVSFSSTPGQLYFDKYIENTQFSLYENGVYQKSGKDFNFFNYRSLIDSTFYAPYSNSREEEVFACSIPNNAYSVSGFTFIPSAGSNYTYSNFPFSLDNNTGYFIYLNGQKLVSGASFDYTITSNTLTINNAANIYDSGTIDIGGIRSGSSRNYINAYETYSPPLYVSGFSYGLIDEVIFLNGQRLKKNDDYFKTSSGKLNLRNSNVARQNSLFFSNNTGFFNV